MNTVLRKEDYFKSYVKPYFKPSINNSHGAYDLVHEAPGSETKANERQSFLDAMANTVNGVHVVTTDGYAGQYGLTVNTVTSVSADPPTILVCINHRSPMREAIRSNGVFCANVLSYPQSKLARIFAGQPKWGKSYDFSRAKWEQGVTGSPRLSKTLASFDCVVEKSVDVGSHTIFIGSVVATVSGNGAPLLYSSRSYGFPYLMGN